MDELRLGNDQFLVVDVIHGGMGVCARVIHEGTGSEFAVKGIRPETLARNEGWARYLWEMKTWVTLSSFEGVVQAYCLADLNDLPFVCATWMKGGNLRPYLSRRDPSFVFSALSRILNTLDYAHRRHSIIHRDLKPENILLDERGVAYLADWGLARSLAEDSGSVDHDRNKTIATPADIRLTAEGSFLGTIVYASPEQILGLSDIDHRSDIYSIGCMLYEWESGLPPFVGDSSKEVAAKHLRDKPKPLSGLFRRTAFGLESVIGKCLNKDPRDRFQDYGSMIKAVADVARAKGADISFLPPQQRYVMHLVGKGGFAQALADGRIPGTGNTEGSFRVVEGEDVEPFLREADALLHLGEWDKAIEILKHLYVPHFIRSIPDNPFHQAVVVSYALGLIKLGQVDAALEALDSIAKAREKRAEYYVNLSLALLHVRKSADAERVARDGLLRFGDDTDLLGNLSIALANQGKYPEATKAAETRLQRRRDLRSLQDAGQLLIQIANHVEYLDWPEAVTNYRLAIKLLQEAKQKNPRYAPVQYKIAEALFKLELFPECLLELKGMVEIPRHRSVIVASLDLWARCFDKVAMHKECVEFCDKMLKQYPTETRIHRIRAETIADGVCIGYKRNGKRLNDQSCYEFFARVLKSRVERRESDYSYYARLVDWMGRTNEAIEVTTEAKTRYPSNWEFPFNLARFYLASGNATAALPVAMEATRLAPWLRQTWNMLESIYGKLQDPTEAQRARQRADHIKTERDRLYHAVKVEIGSSGNRVPGERTVME